ncbi:tRNA methyl transferase [Gracilaria domingensis]|nr:tRNA methyl transferase [Gracilaria domingensis]
MRAVSELIKHGLGTVSKPPRKRSSIYLALSGGVDSSVSALILREAGWRVKPVLMRCWDSGQDEGSTNCFEEELRAAELTVEKLRLEPLQVFDFVKEYWTDVFENVFLGGIRRGFIPNADLACNRWVKFGAFPERVAELSHEDTPIATGHYAMVQHTSTGSRLLAARDEVKDQSYFLASVQEKALRRVVLPVGDLLKTEVVSIASDAQLPAAEAKSSRGICFVGKRSMGEFIEQYVDLNDEGRFVDVDSGDVLGDVTNGYALTVGQRARIAGLAKARFVVGRRGKDIIVASHEHECLRSTGVWCGTADWIGNEPECIADGDEKQVSFKACSTMRMGKAWVKRECGGWSVRFDEERRKIGRGQAVVVYDGRECLGALWPVCEHDEREAVETLQG